MEETTGRSGEEPRRYCNTGPPAKQTTGVSADLSVAIWGRGSELRKGMSIYSGDARQGAQARARCPETFFPTRYGEQ